MTVFGGAEEDRTPDLRIANATLSQLSYRPIHVDSSDTWILMQATSGRTHRHVLKKHLQVLESIDANSIAPL
jgi:hypothetical protein